MEEEEVPRDARLILTAILSIKHAAIFRRLVTTGACRKGYGSLAELKGCIGRFPTRKVS